jgi:serine/threonine protein kinase
MNADPQRRLSAAELLSHSFLTQYESTGSDVMKSVISDLAPLHQRFRARFSHVLSQLDHVNFLSHRHCRTTKIEWSFQPEEVVHQGRFPISRA